MRKRKKYLINFQYQVKYVVKILIPIAVLLGLHWLFVNTILNYQLTISEHTFEVLKNNTQSLESLKEILLKIKELNYLTFQEIKIYLLGASLILLISIFFILSIFFHRTAGPIFRLSKYLKILSEGRQIPPVKVRKQDEFKELAFYLDKLRNHLNEKKNKIEKVANGLEETILSKFKKINSEEDVQKLEFLIKELKELIYQNEI